MKLNFLTPSLLVVGLFVLGGIIFKLSMPNQCAAIMPTDKIFVLTGDARRIPFAMRQTQHFPNADIYVIGAGAQGCITPSHNVTVESTSKSTYQNALAIRDIVTEKKFNRIVVITTEDHINRATYLIHDELPNTEIIACPAPMVGSPAGKRLERWVVEYIKYIVTMFGIKES